MNYDIIGLCGAAGSGKSTVAEILAGSGYRRHRFAGPLKGMFRSLLESAGCELDTVLAMIEGDLKETPAEILSGKTPRHVMQTLGSEWGRDLIASDLWVRIAIRGALADIVEGRSRIVFEDVRFPNEAAAVRDVGGIVIEITGRGGIAGDHASEGLDLAPDLVLNNDGDLEDLAQRLTVLHAAGFHV